MEIYTFEKKSIYRHQIIKVDGIIIKNELSKLASIKRTQYTCEKLDNLKISD